MEAVERRHRQKFHRRYRFRVHRERTIAYQPRQGAHGVLISREQAATVIAR
jgi:hypothetical protein